MNEDTENVKISQPDVQQGIIKYFFYFIMFVLCWNTGCATSTKSLAVRAHGRQLTVQDWFSIKDIHDLSYALKFWTDLSARNEKGQTLLFNKLLARNEGDISSNNALISELLRGGCSPLDSIEASGDCSIFKYFITTLNIYTKEEIKQLNIDITNGWNNFNDEVWIKTSDKFLVTLFILCYKRYLSKGLNDSTTFKIQTIREQYLKNSYLLLLYYTGNPSSKLFESFVQCLRSDMPDLLRLGKSSLYEAAKIGDERNNNNRFVASLDQYSSLSDQGNTQSNIAQNTPAPQQKSQGKTPDIPILKTSCS